MTQNPEFWKPDKPHFEELAFSVTTDENSRFQQIRGGDLDMTKASAIAAKTGVVPGTGVRVEETPQNITDYLLLNQNKPLFKNQKVREAVNLAMDREGIIETATDGKGELGASFLNPAVTYSIQVEPPERDVAKAKQLISEAAKEGVDTGEGFTINSYNFDAYSGIATQIVQQNLEEVGLNVKLQPLDEAALNEELEAGEYQAVLGLFLPGISDPSELSTFYIGFYAPGNGADVAAQTKVIEEGAVEMNEAKREALYGQLQEMVIEEESMLVINYQPVVYPVVEEVTGVEFDPVGNLLLRNAGFTE
jgi:peptide/nickel transport system substrate-binding protein